MRGASLCLVLFILCTCSLSGKLSASEEATAGQLWSQIFPSLMPGVSGPAEDRIHRLIPEIQKLSSDQQATLFVLLFVTARKLPASASSSVDIHNAFGNSSKSKEVKRLLSSLSFEFMNARFSVDRKGYGEFMEFVESTYNR